MRIKKALWKHSELPRSDRHLGVWTSTITTGLKDSRAQQKSMRLQVFSFKVERFLSSSLFMFLASRQKSSSPWAESIFDSNPLRWEAKIHDNHMIVFFFFLFCLPPFPSPLCLRVGWSGCRYLELMWRTAKTRRAIKPLNSPLNKTSEGKSPG